MKKNKAIEKKKLELVKEEKEKARERKQRKEKAKKGTKKGEIRKNRRVTDRTKIKRYQWEVSTEPCRTRRRQR